jgi:CRP-like cAMP-binding protein
MAEYDFEQLQILQGLGDEQRKRLLSLFTPCEFQTGQTIFEQGNLARSLYLVMQGEVVVLFKPEDGPEMVVARIHPQGVVGWSAAIGSPCYTSSVKCSADSLLVRIDGDDLRNLCGQEPELGKIFLERLAIIIAERLRNTYAQVYALLEQGLRLNVGEWLDSEQVQSF